MRIVRRMTLACAAAAVAGSGCANVHVKKVSVEKRIQGTDEHVKGFRYYLSRPYLVVKKRLPVLRKTWQARLVHARYKGAVPLVNPPKFALQGLTPEPGEATAGLYDLSGHRLADLEWDNLGPATPAVFEQQVAGGQGGASGHPVPAGGAGGGVLPKPGSTPPTPATPTPSTSAASLGDLAALPADSNHIPQGFRPGLAAGMPRAEVEKPAEPDVSYAIQFVNMPDFEEQFAIKNKNKLAKSKYELHFTDGWSLDSTTGSWNATDVPVRLLQSVQNAIGALSAFEQKAVKPADQASASPPMDVTGPRAAGEVRYEIRRVFAIEPGIYRIQKSWERLPPVPPDELSTDQAFGLLKDLGLPVVESTSATKI